jgi:hypothetical protein
MSTTSKSSIGKGRASMSDSRKQRIETERGTKSSGCCDIDIDIDCDGDVNIYNCSAPPERPCPPPPCDEYPSLPPAEGACVPLALGAKPKQSRKRKLERLLENNPVPSALAVSFFHFSRRFLAGRPAANPLEESVFNMLQSLPPETKGVLSCAVGSFDSISGSERNRLFGASLPSDPNVPIDANRLAEAFAKELKQRVGTQVFNDPDGTEEERPGQNRFFKPGVEDFTVQLRICRVNGLRTVSFDPPLLPGDFLPEELQQHCEPVLVNGQPKLNCEVQKGNCPGNFLADLTCLRVPEVETEHAVMLEGVNFISTDAKVRLTAQSPGTFTREVDAHVVGDIDTPLTEVVNGSSVTIRDCRVHDRMSFVVSDDAPPGIYSVQIAMPNVSGFPDFGDTILSNVEFIQVVPPSTARFQISSETLHAREETSPASFGSDEVRVRVSAFPITATLTDLILGDEQRFDSPEFGDVDSGETRDMTAVLFHQDAPIDGVAMVISGYEIDSEKAYRDQINTFTDAFLHYLKIALAAIATGLGAGALALGLKDLIKLGLAHPIILAIAAAITLAVIIFVSLWAPADLIIEDSLGLTTLDLVGLTNANLPLPSSSAHTSQQGIKVTVTPLEKSPNQYRERRDYRSDDEDSIYQITFRYNRIA